MHDMLHFLCDALRAGRPVAMATIVRQAGSAPRGAGSRLAVDDRGQLAGTTGGGLAEARTIETCKNALRSGVPTVLDFAMDGTLAARSEMICGGRVTVLVEPFSPADLPLLEKLPACMDAQGCLLARPFPPRTGLNWTLLLPDGRREGAALSDAAALDLARQAAPMRASEDAAILEAEGQRWFVEPCRRRERLILAGGGHVSRPTATIAALTDFDVVVMDDRQEFANAERFPEAHTIKLTPEYEDCFDDLHISPLDYIVIVTRGHLFDGRVLAQALKTPAGYIGMIGSTRKRDEIYANLLAQGFTQADLQRVHCPIGLPIKAETPEEIAASIIAECIAHKRHA